MSTKNFGYYDTQIVKCKWRELVRFTADGEVFKGLTCHNPDAIREMKNGADCPFHGNMKADTCNYFERQSFHAQEKVKP